MNIYIAFLRGVNVSGRNKIKMAELREMFQNIGFSEVKTYIQSGNIIFQSDEENIEKLEGKIRNSIQDTFGFEIAVLIKIPNEIALILKENPFNRQEDLDANRIYYTLIKTGASLNFNSSLRQEDYPNELFSIHSNCVYLNCLNGAGKAKLTNNIIERKLKVEATTRNHRTMLKLLALSE